MKKENETAEADLQPEYDLTKLSGRVRGKYADKYRQGTNLVLLDADVAKAFPTDQAVNEALRLLIQIAETHVVNQDQR